MRKGSGPGDQTLHVQRVDAGVDSTRWIQAFRMQTGQVDEGASDSRADAGDGAAVSVAPKFVMLVVQISALALVLVARRFGIVADEPLWAYAGRSSARRSSAGGSTGGPTRRAARGGCTAGDIPHGTVMTVIYLTGWGPALGVCFVYAGLVDSSSRARRRGARCSAGRSVVPRRPDVGAPGWVPSFLSARVAERRVSRRVRVRHRDRDGGRDRRRQAKAEDLLERARRSEAHAPSGRGERGRRDLHHRPRRTICRSTRRPKRSSAGPRPRSSANRRAITVPGRSARHSLEFLPFENRIRSLGTRSTRRRDHRRRGATGPSSR